MRESKHSLQVESVPLHLQVRKHLKTRISRLSVGAKLPTERALAGTFGVGLVTVRRAMLDLAREGYVVRHRGRGTFVRKQFRVGNSKASNLKTIALVVPGMEIPQNVSILKGVKKQAKLHGYGVMVYDCRLSCDRERSILEKLSHEEIAGIIAVPFDGDTLENRYAEILNELQAGGAKVVLVDQYVASADVPVVMTDRTVMGYKATEHLIMLGHRQIGYACTASYDTGGQQCLRAYKRALADYGIEHDSDLVIDLPVRKCAEPTQQAVHRILGRNPDAFTAIATHQFSMTYGILQALKELGKRVPEDIAVVGAETYLNPDLAHVTHIVQDFETMGDKAVELMLNDDGWQSMKRHVLLPPKFVIGTTCGAKGPGSRRRTEGVSLTRTGQEVEPAVVTKS